MRKLFVGLLITVALFITTLLSGCEQPTQVGGQPRPKIYRAIVSLSPSTTEILLSNSINIIGRTSACTFPEFQIKSIPIVGDVKPNYEKLTRMKPDFIVYESNLYNEQDKQKIKALGADVFEMKSTTLAEYEKEIAELGAKVGGESNLAEYIDKVHRAAAKGQADAPNPRPKVAVILAGATGSHLIMGTKGFLGDCYRAAGGDLVGPETDKFEVLKPEFLLSADPDVIFVPGKAEDFLKDTRMSSLKAVKNKRVFGINADVALRRGARVQQFIENLSKALSLKNSQ